MFFIRARNLKQTIIQHDNAQRAQLHARCNLYFVHVVNSKCAGLLNPVLDEWVAQSVFGLSFRKIRAFDYETIFAHFSDYRV